MSRFWGGDSDSESESDSTSSSSDDEENVAKGSQRVWAIDSDSESDDGARVVKSAKDKAFEELAAVIDKCKNHIKIGDWSGIQGGQCPI